MGFLKVDPDLQGGSKVRDSCRGVLERWFGAENRGRGGLVLAPSGLRFARIGETPQFCHSSRVSLPQHSLGNPDI
ncbi:hypothetical protein Tco_0702129 [Tanacetum coccineum]|uniref:Uncharacterized protein n=1 Tax=Tanacetum coccineum TaxID=301880 RepID=A0ABQ4XX34_9ASTR